MIDRCFAALHRVLRIGFYCLLKQVVRILPQGLQPEAGKLTVMFNGFYFILLPQYLTGGDPADIDLSGRISGKLIQDHCPVRDLVLRKGFLQNENACQGVTHRLCRLLFTSNGLYTEHRDVVMRRLHVDRHDPAAFDARLPGKFRLHPARVVFCPVFMQEEPVRPAEIDDLPVGIQVDKVVRADERFAGYRFNADKLLSVELSAGHGIGVKVQHAVRGRVFPAEENALLFIKKADLDPGDGTSQGVIVRIRQGEDACSSQLAQAVAADEVGILAAMFPEEGKIPFFIARGNKCAAGHEEAQA